MAVSVRSVRRWSVAAVVASAAVAPSVAVAEGSVDPLPRIVTLGDSYSSGQGIHADAGEYDDHGPPRHSFDPDTRLGGSACHRETDTTPGARLAADLDATASMIACAGAVVAEIPNQLAAARIQGDGTGTIVAITVGGNDVRTVGGGSWPDVLVDCIVSARCDRDDDNEVANFDRVEADLAELYTTIGERYPELTVRVLGYPRLMQREWWGCPGVTGVGRGEADWIDRETESLNDLIERASTDAATTTGADIIFVPVADEFDGHGACRFWQRDRYVNDRVTGATYSRRLGSEGEVVERTTDTWWTISGASFHPGQRGYDAYYQALRDSL